MISINNKVNCCGCEACYNVCPKNCIQMVSDNQGFLYPQVEGDRCIECGLCENVCPIINHVIRENNEKQRGYILQHKDKEICQQSTAGGAFTEIATYVINQGGIVFGVELTEDYVVRHVGIENKGELVKFRNSKYVQSRIGDIFKQIKKELLKGRQVCFSGTPCQVEGLRGFLGKEYSNLILVDIVCRAVPSPGVWEKYIKYEVDNKGEISSIRFRDKTLGYQYSTMQLKTKNGKCYRGGIEVQPWLRMFFSGMIIRPSCTECQFRSRYRNSDYTIWDCFPSYKFDKSFDEKKGTTRMLVHTEKGQSLLAKIEEQYKIKEIDSDKIVEGVMEMLKSPTVNSRSEDFYKKIQLEGYERTYKYFYHDYGISYVKYLVRRILNILGIDTILKRILKH